MERRFPRREFLGLVARGAGAASVVAVADRLPSFGLSDVAANNAKGDKKEQFDLNKWVLGEARELEKSGAFKGFGDPAITLGGLEWSIGTGNDELILGELGYLAGRTQIDSFTAEHKNGELPEQTRANEVICRISNVSYEAMREKHKDDPEMLCRLRTQKQRSNFEWDEKRLDIWPFRGWVKMLDGFPAAETDLKLAIVTRDEYPYMLDTMMNSCGVVNQPEKEKIDDLTRIKRDELIPRMMRWAELSGLTATNKKTLRRAWSFFCKGIRVGEQPVGNSGGN